MDEIYKIIDSISDEVYKEHLKKSCESLYSAKGLGYVYIDGLVSSLCWYGIDKGFLSAIDGNYIREFIHENAELKLKYQRKKHK